MSLNHFIPFRIVHLCFAGQTFPVWRDHVNYNDNFPLTTFPEVPGRSDTVESNYGEYGNAPELRSVFSAHGIVFRKFYLLDDPDNFCACKIL